MKNSIKIWPNLDDISQALIPYSDTNLNPNNTIYIDLSNVVDVSASGAAMTIVKLLKIVKKFPNSTWSVIEPTNVIVKELFSTIGFYHILNKDLINKDLWWQLHSDKPAQTYQYKNKQGFNVSSLPLYHLKYDSTHYRASVELFMDYVVTFLSPRMKEYDFRLNIMAKLLTEIAKNSEDHTKDHAYFGLDIVEANHWNKSTILFSFCDLGIGIHENIKRFISSQTEYGSKNGSKKFGIVDSYHKAFEIGYSTSNDDRNKGIGMSMILDCANLLDMELSIFDAKSRGFIPSNNTHSEIRRNFWNTNNLVGFNYYGKLIVNYK